MNAAEKARMAREAQKKAVDRDLAKTGVYPI